MFARARLTAAVLILSVIPAVTQAAGGAAPATPLTPPAIPPATAPAASTPAVPHAGDTLSADALIDYYADHFEIIFAKTVPLNKDVTLRRDIPADPEAAIDMLNDVLATQSLATWRVHRNPPPGEASSGRIVLQVMSLSDVKNKQRDESPVTRGTDPNAIDISERDRIVTHMIPVSNPQLLDSIQRAAQAEKDVTATVLGSQTIGYQLVLTGPALNVRHAVAAVINIDRPSDKAPPVVRNMHLENIDAPGAAVTVNQLYGPNILGDKSVRALADPRTNTIILTGPEAEVIRVIGDLTLQDKGPLPPPRNRP